MSLPTQYEDLEDTGELEVRAGASGVTGISDASDVPDLEDTQDIPDAAETVDAEPFFAATAESDDSLVD